MDKTVDSIEIANGFSKWLFNTANNGIISENIFN